MNYLLLIAMALVTHLPRNLVFEQDFSKLTDVDEAVWHFNDGPVYNNELEKYTKKPAKNVWVEGGTLVIEARKKNDVVTSGRLESKQSWKYGRFEIEAKVPGGRGTWPAIWMLNDKIRSDKPGERLGWPKCGEIDIMENVGYDPHKYHFTVHSEKYNHMKNTQRGSSKVVEEASPGFHTYVFDWQPGSIELKMDGATVYSLKKTEDSFDAWPFDDSYYLILNLAVGGDWGGSKGVDPAIFPSRLLIKSVRIYQ